MAWSSAPLATIWHDIYHASKRVSQTPRATLVLLLIPNLDVIDLLITRLSMGWPPLLVYRGFLSRVYRRMKGPR